jgi:excisionase family DNA binding protein
MEALFNKNLLSTKKASELSGYTSDYIARLARSGKISAQRVGHTWFVDLDSLQQFLEQQESRKII